MEVTVNAGDASAVPILYYLALIVAVAVFRQYIKRRYNTIYNAIITYYLQAGI